MNIDVAIIGRRPRPELMAWLRQQEVGGLDFYAHRHEGYIARNQAVVAFLARGEAEYLLMLDADHVPEARTENILVEPGEFLYCACVAATPQGNTSGPDGFSGGCMRVSRGLLRDIEAKLSPTAAWFYRATANHGTVELVCPAFWFREQAKAVGFVAREAGCIGHVIDGEICYLPSSYHIGGRAREIVAA